MSYLSTVAVKCEEKAFEMFKEVYAEYGLMPDGIYEEDGFKIIWFDWQKWNLFNEDIIAFEDVKDKLDEHYDEDGYRYSYLRIGEILGEYEKNDNGLDESDCLEYKIEIDLDCAKDITDYSLLS